MQLTYTESTSLSNLPSMPESTPTHRKKGQSSIIPQIEKLLTEQTSVILQAVDEKLSAQDKRIEEGFAAQDKRMEEKFIAQEIRILAAVDKRLAKTEERFAKSLDELTKTIERSSFMKVNSSSMSVSRCRNLSGGETGRRTGLKIRLI